MGRECAHLRREQAQRVLREYAAVEQTGVLGQMCKQLGADRELDDVGIRHAAVKKLQTGFARSSSFTANGTPANSAPSRLRRS